MSVSENSYVNHRFPLYPKVEFGINMETSKFRSSVMLDKRSFPVSITEYNICYALPVTTRSHKFVSTLGSTHPHYTDGVITFHITLVVQNTAYTQEIGLLLTFVIECKTSSN